MTNFKCPYCKGDTEPTNQDVTLMVQGKEFVRNLPGYLCPADGGHFFVDGDAAAKAEREILAQGLQEKHPALDGLLALRRK